MKRLLFLLLLIISTLFSATPTVMKFKISGAIGPATTTYIKDGIASAHSYAVQLILIELNSPGRLSTSMKDIIQSTLDSSIPVVTYIYPKGAIVGSAGVHLLYASHIAAMSNETKLVGDTSINPFYKQKSNSDLNYKNISLISDVLKYDNSLSAEDAFHSGVIDLIATDTNDLLAKLHGTIVKVSDKKILLNSKDANIINYQASYKTRILSVITNPNMAYIFLLIAIYGIFFEFMNPGSIFPGVLGGISAVMALYTLNILPFSYSGLILIFLGILFIVAEVFVIGFGILGIGGIISFSIGSVLLFDAHILGSSVSLTLVLALTIFTLAFFVLAIKLFLTSRSAKVVSGVENLIGSMAEVTEAEGDTYHVDCMGEVWDAKSNYELSIGEKVEVVRLLGLRLEVKPTKG